jgi:putative alpha-1,2-mannosidase
MKQRYVECTPAEGGWMVNFDLAGLIQKLGGNERACARLDQFFTKLNVGPRADTAYMGNEPCEGIPWIYDFAGAPHRTQEIVRRIQQELFTDSPSGLPGNDDAGSLSSWYVFSALGLYPEIPAVAGFAVGSPLFPAATLHLEDGKPIQILGKGAAATNPFVKNLKLNGRNYESPWIPWPALAHGAVLSFSLGNQPTPWGSNSKAPSFEKPAP